jgi:hypothetical protein
MTVIEPTVVLVVLSRVLGSTPDWLTGSWGKGVPPAWQQQQQQQKQKQ